MKFISRRTHDVLPTMSSFQHEMNRLVEDFFNDGWNQRWPSFMNSSSVKPWNPKVNLLETHDEYRMEAELPGIEEKDIELTFNDNILTLKGERKFKETSDNENIHQVEMHFGQFKRSFSFDKKIDSEKIKADFKNGILTVALGKKENLDLGPKKISIQY